MTDKILFTKAARRDQPIGEKNRLPSRFEVDKASIEKPEGNYARSACGNFLVLTPYDSKVKIAIPINKIQTYVETDETPVDPLAPKA